MRWPIPVVVCSVALTLSAPPAAAAVQPVHGRGLHAQAGFYAGILGDGHARIQVLDQLCRNPDRQRRCEAAKPALERAVSRLVDRPITWVSKPTSQGGVFWVLGPVRFGTAKASVRWAWRDLRPFGCIGGGRLTYGRDGGTWNLVAGIGYEGCPANAGSG
jgi:hypothetical protein